MKKCISCILIFSLCMVLLTGCGGDKRVEQEYLLSGEYFKDQTITEHTEYLANMFYTALPYSLDYKSYGLTNLTTFYGYDLSKDKYISEYEYDRLYPNINNYYYASKIPVFYGLLKETAVFEEKMGIDTSKLAKKHGTKYAVRAEDVEDFCTMIFRRTDVQVQHQSTSGAEYIEEDDVYVYDELINPLQQFYDNGWELDILPFNLVEEDTSWNGGYVTVGNSYTPIWYASDGTVYDLYGEKYFVQEDPANRFVFTGEMVVYMYENGFIKYNSHFYEGSISVGFDSTDWKSPKGVDFSAPLSYIYVGKLYTGYGPDV